MYIRLDFSDPPDEIIEREPPPSVRQPVQPSIPAILTSQSSFLSCAVATVRSDGAFKIRTLLGILYSLILTVVTELYTFSFSYIVAMLLMELTLLVALVMLSKSGVASMSGDWILQMRGILAFLHPLLPKAFEIVYLSLYAFAIVLRDLFIMIFCVVVFKSIVAIATQSWLTVT